MTSQIQFVKMKNDDRLQIFVTDKLEKLEQKYSWIINAKVFLKEEPFKDNHIKNKACEIELSVPGPNIFSKTHHESFEAAIADGFAELDKLLKKHKHKMYRNVR